MYRDETLELGGEGSLCTHGRDRDESQIRSDSAKRRGVGIMNIKFPYWAGIEGAVLGGTLQIQASRQNQGSPREASRQT